MEQGGMHNHTKFYIVEVLLGLVLVGIVVLFYFWTGSLNDQIAVLEMEKVDLEGQLTAEGEQEEEEVADVIPVLQIAGKTLRLVPDRHGIELNGVKIGSVEGQTGSPAIDLLFMKTTNDQIVGIRLENRDGLFTTQEDYFVDPDSSSVAYLQQGLSNWFSPSSPPQTSVHFGETEYALSVDLRDVVDECVNATSPTCGTGIVYGLLVNGDQIVAFEAFNVEFSEHAEGGVWTPSLTLTLLGVSSDLSKVYFSFRSETYSIDETGMVSQVALPDDLVTMTDEAYE